MTKQIRTNWNGELKQNEPMSKHTSWRVGGTADIYFQPASIADAQAFLAELDSSTPVTWTGLGSNLLVRDGGIRGAVINATGLLKDIRFLNNQRVYAEAGLACPKLARLTVKQALAGLEFMCGIPGTLGGALAMNAGAMGGETWDNIESVVMLDRQGVLSEHKKISFAIAYRSVQTPIEGFFVAATFKLKHGDKSASDQQIKTYLARRASTQPTQLPNAGSVFRNPQGDFAARLIEEAGLKGFAIGGASVSEKHANFIINTGTATAKDIEDLIAHIKNTVKQVHDVTLHAEVRVIGEK